MGLLTQIRGTGSAFERLSEALRRCQWRRAALRRQARPVPVGVKDPRGRVKARGRRPLFKEQSRVRKGRETKR